MISETRSLRKTCYVGMAIDTAAQPCRDIMLGIVGALQRHPDATPCFFHANTATSPANLAAFAASGVDGLICCGVRPETLAAALRRMPAHPPVVVCADAPLRPDEHRALGIGGTVVADNEAIGREAADFFLARGLQNFAFLNGDPACGHIAARIRCRACRTRIVERLGCLASFMELTIGQHDEATGDFWEPERPCIASWIDALPVPCGVLANGDREAYLMLEYCRRAGRTVPGHVEILGVDCSQEFCELTIPAISSLHAGLALCAQTAVQIVLELIADPQRMPPERHDAMVSTFRFVERGSTSSDRDYGHLALRVNEYVRAHACEGIGVPDVVAHMGVSRRMLEKHMRAVTGKSVLEMIRKVRIENVRRLLELTDLSITEVMLRSGYELTSNLGNVFKRKYGMTMSTYRDMIRKRDRDTRDHRDTRDTQRGGALP